jgi:cytochrome c
LTLKRETIETPMTSASCRATLALALLATLAPVTHADTGPLASYAPPSDPALLERIARADVAAGERTFDRRCSTCHDAEKTGKHSKGPLLWNVVGRKAGSSPGFAFSDAMRRSGHTWTLEALDYFLADTERAVPGRAMDFVGIADEKVRAELVAYLRTMSDAPGK